mmetsp:Transcript_12096/g.37852  ORF Transcript_12096/g.37852 Transcript_12096/m.37852 type:complete len:161 (-) Transcript_12096:194-676(-)
MGDWWGGVNRALRISHLPKTETKSLVQPLPEWVKVNARLCYVSKSNGQSHHVLVKKVEERQKMVVIIFEQNRKTWKRVPFSEIAKLGDGTLRPLWKQSAAPTVANKPRDYIEIDDAEEEEEAAGPPLGPAPSQGDGQPAEVPGSAGPSRERSRSPRRAED